MICLFGGLIKMARLQFEDGTYESVANRLSLDVEMIKDFENNVLNPDEDVISKFSEAYDISIDHLNFYIFHDEEPKKLSQKFRKWSCVKISQVIHKMLKG